MTIAIRKADLDFRADVPITSLSKRTRASRRIVLVLSTLATIAFAAQPAAAFDKSTLIAHKSIAWSGTQAHRGGHVVFPAPHVGSFTAAPPEVSGGICDFGDNPMIC
ncbi:hypothetical protein [Bradyrhizobium genosp. P]|uniref:hypothetical protein n=1 Tax=Bradyrhizobium genosp. P TaxID=83641 RepID=UPI003CFA30CF